MTHAIACLFVLSVSTAAAQPASRPTAPPTALDLVNKAVVAEDQNYARVRNYIMVENKVENHLDSSGQVKSSKKTAHEVMFVESKRYERLIERDGKPLSADDQRKEEKKLEKFIEKQRNMSASERQKEAEKDRKERADLLKLLPEAFDFSLRGEETKDGRAVYRIDAIRKPGFKPKNRSAEVLSKMQGTMWVDKDEHLVVAADVQIMEPISFGWFIAKLNPGARLQYEQTRVNNEVWLPKRLDMRADVRFLGRQNRLHSTTAVTGHRKFSADARVLSVSETDQDGKPTP